MNYFRYLLPALFIVLFFKAHGQGYHDSQLADGRAVKLRSRTLVVIRDDNNPFDRLQVQAVKDFWTFTPYIVAGSEDVDKYLSDPQYAVLLYTNKIFEHGEAKIVYAGLGIFLGKENEPWVDEKKLVCMEYLGSTIDQNIEADDDVYKLAAFYIQRLQVKVKDLAAGIVVSTWTDKKAGVGYYFLKDKKDSLYKKTIYILKDIASENDVLGISKRINIPAASFILVNKQQMSDTLYSGNKNAVFIYSVFSQAYHMYDQEGRLLASIWAHSQDELDKVYKQGKRYQLIALIVIGIGLILGALQLWGP